MLLQRFMCLIFVSSFCKKISKYEYLDISFLFGQVFSVCLLVGDVIYECIVGVIMEYCFMLGIKLVEEKFVGIFSVNCMWVCEVLVWLVYEGLIMIIFNCGVFVVSFMLEEVCNIFVVCCMLELVLLCYLCEYMWFEYIVLLCVYVVEEVQVCVSNDWCVIIWFLGEFYICIVDMVDNLVMSKMMCELVLLICFIIVLYDLLMVLVCIYDDYGDIIDVIFVGCIEDVVVIMLVYLYYIESVFDMFVLQGEDEDLEVLLGMV